MAQKLFRRDKSGAGMVWTEVVGPIEGIGSGASAPHQKLSFNERNVLEMNAAGQAERYNRWVAIGEIISGKKYMLSWVISGKIGDEVEFFLDRQNDPAGAAFKSIAKDKIPETGAEETAVGLIWRNGIFFEG